MRGITYAPFGTTVLGEEVLEFCLENLSGAKVKVLNRGATIRSILLPDSISGEPIDICLGYSTLGEYECNEGYFGATVGRFANRIQGGHFTLDGKDYQLAKNDGNNHLHGGAKGFNAYIWNHSIKGNVLTLSRTSPDGEEGYPGTMQVEATFTLDDNNALEVTYRAKCDQDTYVSIANHAYFNLDGECSGDVLSHLVQIRGSNYLPISDMIPTGEIRPVLGTPFNFTTPKKIGRDITSDDPQIQAAGGYDHNFVVDGEGYREFATVVGQKSGITMTMFSNTPGVQFYTGNFITGHQTSKSDWPYRKHAGFCLETQAFPDAMNHENFPSPLLGAGEEFMAITTYRFGRR